VIWSLLFTDGITVLDEMGYRGDTVGNLRRMKSKSLFALVHRVFLLFAVRVTRSQTVGGLSSPSDSVKSFSAVTATITRADGPRHGRPSDLFGPPTFLFDQALAALKYDFEHLDRFTPTPTNVDSAFELVATACDVFPSEDERNKALRRHLDVLLRGATWGTQIRSGTAIPDAPI